MEAVGSLILLGSVLLVPGQRIAKEPGPLTFQEIAAGTWGFDAEGASCDDNPHRIEFSADGQFMWLRYSKGVDGELPPITEYRLIDEGPGFMRMRIMGETRTTEADDLIEWDMVLLTPDAYCWHRTDWEEGGCTQPAYRCSPGGAANR